MTKGAWKSILAALMLCSALTLPTVEAMAQARPVMRPNTPTPTTQYGVTHPAANDNVPNAVRGIIDYKARQQGIPANDNRIQVASNAALDFMAGGAASAAVGTGVMIGAGVIGSGVAIGTAPAWLVGGAIILVGIGVGGAISWLASGGWSWTVETVINQTTGEPEIKVDPVTGEPMVMPSELAAMVPLVAGAPAISNCPAGVQANCLASVKNANAKCEGGSIEVIAYCTAMAETAYVQSVNVPSQIPTAIRYGSNGTFTFDRASGQTNTFPTYQTYGITSPTSCAGYVQAGVCHEGSVAPASKVTPAFAIAAVPPQYWQNQMDTGKVAEIVNGAWQGAAAQPGYAGVPYSPITAADVANAIANNPAVKTNLADWLAPVSQTGTWPNPGPITQPNPNPAPVTNPGTNPAVDYNAMPGSTSNPANIKMPCGVNGTPACGVKVENWGELEPATDALDATIADKLGDENMDPAKILEPLGKLFPGLKALELETSGQCPAPKGEILDDFFGPDGPESITFDFAKFCQWMESLRGVIGAAMMLCWTFIGVKTFLKA